MKPFILLCLILCARGAIADSVQVLREESRQVLRGRACGTCHVPPGMPGAIKVYDLSKVNWSATMTERQLKQIIWRIHLTDEEIRELHEDPKQRQFTTEEINLLNKFVAAELESRNPAASLIHQSN